MTLRYYCLLLTEMSAKGFSGDYTCEETHVPIPNTNVKLTGPMIVPNSAKVGYCRNHYGPEHNVCSGLFSFAALTAGSPYEPAMQTGSAEVRDGQFSMHVLQG